MISRSAHVALVVSALSLVTAFAHAEPPPPDASTASEAMDARKTEARSHFDLGVSHFDREEWPAALVEFLKSREIFVSRGNTKNAAICLRKVGRFDEALDMFEALLRDFPDLSPTDRSLAEHEVAELQASVGTIEVRDAPPGATVSIDATDRGRVPLAGAIRVSAGSHAVRVTLEGTLPFEARIDLAGRQAAVVHAQLAPLTRAGRLRVTEHDGKLLEVVVDGAVVGKTPWEGAVAPGPHSVLSRGEGALGSPPALVEVKVDSLTAIDITAKELRAALWVASTPKSAEIAVDGTPVGHGAWRGRLEAGPHRVAVSLDGYTPFSQSFSLASDEERSVDATLSAVVGARPHFSLEADGVVPLGVLWGGDLASGCSGGCSMSLPVGAGGLLHATYETPSGMGVGVHGGYLWLSESMSGRRESLTPVGLAPISGSAADDLHLSGLAVGADAQYAVRSAWPVTLRLGLGVLLGSVSDDRRMSSGGFSGTVATTQRNAGDYAYVAPEVRVGRRFGDHFEVNVGLSVVVMTALVLPRWDAGRVVDATIAGRVNEAVFGSETLAGSVMIVAMPGAGAKYAF